VTVGLLGGDFIFDAVLTVLSAVKIVAGFYKVQYERIKQAVLGCVHVFVSNSPGCVSAKNWQNRMTSD